jgi:hypothetical protein
MWKIFSQGSRTKHCWRCSYPLSRHTYVTLGSLVFEDFAKRNYRLFEDTIILKMWGWTWLPPHPHPLISRPLRAPPSLVLALYPTHNDLQPISHMFIGRSLFLNIMCAYSCYCRQYKGHDMFGNQSIAMAGTAPPPIGRGILPQRMHSWCWKPPLLHCPSFHHHSIYLPCRLREYKILCVLWKAAQVLFRLLGEGQHLAIVATTLNVWSPKLCFPSSFSLSALEKKMGWCQTKIWTCLFQTMSHYKPKTCITCVQSVSGQN